MRDIPNYKGIYTITTDGKVWSNYRCRFLSWRTSRDGYPMIELVGMGKNKRKRKGCYIHRLVAETYIPNPRNMREVNHKNGIKTDNRVENLEWTTRSENMKHAIRTGLKVLKTDTDHPSTKLSIQQIATIFPRLDGKYGTNSKIAREYNVSPSLVSKIGKGYRIKYT